MRNVVYIKSPIGIAARNRTLGCSAFVIMSFNLNDFQLLELIQQIRTSTIKLLHLFGNQIDEQVIAICKIVRGVNLFMLARRIFGILLPCCCSRGPDKFLKCLFVIEIYMRCVECCCYVIRQVEKAKLGFGYQMCQRAMRHHSPLVRKHKSFY